MVKQTLDIFIQQNTQSWKEKTSWMDFKGTTLSEKAYLKCYTLFDSIYITSLKWQNYTNGGQISGYQGLEGRAGRMLPMATGGQWGIPVLELLRVLAGASLTYH